MSSLLEELTRIQERCGWLPEPELRTLARRRRVPLHRLEGLSTFYTHFRREPPQGPVLHVCRDVACRMAGSREALAALRERLRRDGVEVRETSCLGRCERAPAARSGEASVCLRDAAAVARAIAEPHASERAPRRWDADPWAASRDHYGALRAALAAPPDAVVAELDAAGLRGMGGAGFPTGRKWRMVAAQPAAPKHVICNADESEPGTFKDREILHDLPHLVVEGMALAGRAVGATRGSVFIRHEYAPERKRLEGAIADARTRGALGDRVFGSDFAFDIDIFVSPGGYILGEETALLECMEDRRGEPRNKPPFPGEKGLHGRPTLINNVETFAHSAAIAARGAAWWRGLGVRGRAGHKFMAVCGDVARPDVVLVPMGTTLRELLDLCGGPAEGSAIRAVAPGGASSLWLDAAALDTPIDFDTLRDAGSMLGSGAAIFVREDRDLYEVGLDVARFFRNESCGKCVPCRVGTEKAVAQMERAATAAARSELAEALRPLHHTLERTSICGLGQVALAPMLSILERFPEATRAAGADTEDASALAPPAPNDGT